jgi:pimeloyl-ACP methyl ester carboxylesterase
MNAGYLERPEGRIAYDDTGGDGRLVIASPGMGDLRSTYRHLVPRLVESGMRVVTMDLRGLGGSSTTFTDWSEEAVASDMVALIDHLAAGPAVVIGNSMSAGAAVIAAVDAPERVAGLALIGPFARKVPVPWWQVLAFRALLGGPWGRKAWVSYYRSKLYPGPTPPDHDDHVAAVAANLAESGRMAAFRGLAKTDHAGADRRLDAVTQPAVVVMGTDDPDFPDPAAEARHLAGVLGAEVVLVEGSGHYPQADHPDVVAPAVRALVERVDA